MEEAPLALLPADSCKLSAYALATRFPVLTYRTTGSVWYDYTFPRPCYAISGSRGITSDFGSACTFVPEASELSLLTLELLVLKLELLPELLAAPAERLLHFARADAVTRRLILDMSLPVSSEYFGFGVRVWASGWVGLGFQPSSSTCRSEVSAHPLAGLSREQVQGVGRRGWDRGSGPHGSELRVQGSRFRAYGLGSRV
eukprot:3128255-Rhodomonas_salina.3